MINFLLQKEEKKGITSKTSGDDGLCCKGASSAEDVIEGMSEESGRL